MPALIFSVQFPVRFPAVWSCLCWSYCSECVDLRVDFFLGGIGFPVLHDIWSSRSFQEFSLHSKIVLVASTFLIVVGACSIFAFEYANPKHVGGLPIQGKKYSGSLFQSVTPRTAGYNTIDMSKLYDGTLLLLIILMFIGAHRLPLAAGLGHPRLQCWSLPLLPKFAANMMRNVMVAVSPKNSFIKPFQSCLFRLCWW